MYGSNNTMLQYCYSTMMLSHHYVCIHSGYNKAAGTGPACWQKLDHFFIVWLGNGH